MPWEGENGPLEVMQVEDHRWFIQHHPVHGDRARVVRPRPRPQPRESDLARDGFDRELNVSEAVALRKRRGG